MYYTDNTSQGDWKPLKNMNENIFFQKFSILYVLRHEIGDFTLTNIQADLSNLQSYEYV